MGHGKFELVIRYLDELFHLLYVIRIKNEEGVNYKDLIYIKCNAHVTKIKICIGHFSVEILENVLF